MLVFGDVYCIALGLEVRLKPRSCLAGHKYHRHGEGVATCHGDVGGLGGFAHVNQR